jgi:hypothetical protein
MFHLFLVLISGFAAVAHSSQSINQSSNTHLMIQIHGIQIRDSHSSMIRRHNFPFKN